MSVLEVAETGEKLGSKPIIVSILDLRDCVLEIMFKVVSVIAPDGIGANQKYAA